MVTEERDAIKDPILRFWDKFRIHYRTPFHVHTFTQKPDMSVKQCVICGDLAETPTGFYTPMDIAPGENLELATEPLEWFLDPERANVPSMRKRRSGALYEAHKENIRLVLSHHGVLVNDGWGFWSEELVEDLAGVK